MNLRFGDCDPDVRTGGIAREIKNGVADRGEPS